MLSSAWDSFSQLLTVVLCVVPTVLFVVRRHTDAAFLREGYIHRSSVSIGWTILVVTIVVNED